MLEQIRPLISRFLAAWFPALLVWLSTKLGFELSDDMVQTAVEASAFLAIYAVSHRLLSRGTNPGDAATPAMVEQERALQRRATSTDYIDG